MFNSHSNPTMKNLDTQYFDLEHQEERGDNIYQVYRPLYSCIGLYSVETNVPLCIVQLKAKNSDYAKSIIYKRPIENETLNRFHGMLDQDGQAFSLIVTNPSDTDHLYYNILRGHSALNEINLIPPSTSYAVASDQHAEHKELILRSIEASTGKALTVKEDEKIAKETNTAQKGLSLKLTVSPQQDSDLATLFEKPLEWRMLDRLLLSKPRYIPYIWGSQATASSNPPATESRVWSAASHPQSAAKSRSSNGSNYSGSNLSRPASTGGSFAAGSASGVASTTAVPMHKDDDDWEECSLQMKCKKKRAVPDERTWAEEVDEVDEGDEGDEADERKSVTSQNWIEDSKAAQLDYGDKMTVHGQSSSVVVAFHLQCPPCELGLSVAIGLEFTVDAHTTERVVAAKELIEAYYSQKFESMLQKTIRYESEQCCICLEDDSRPDMIFFKCGHCCVHQICGEKLDNCPFCRQYIEARLKLPVTAPKAPAPVQSLGPLPITVAC